MYNTLLARLAKVENTKHTGVDGQQIRPQDLLQAANYFALAKITLTAAQVKALHTTPITIVPAPGPNSAIIVMGITARLVYNGTAYTGANNLELRYTGASGAKVTADMGSTFLNGTATAYDSVAGVVTELTPAINAPITVSVPVANPGTGNSPITFTTKYRIINP